MNHYLVRRCAAGSALLALAAAYSPAQISFAPSWIQPAGAATRHVVSGDFGGDHRPDLALASDAGLLVLLSQCGGGYASLPVGNGIVLTERGSLATGDVDGDGHLDLVAVRVGSQPTDAEVVVLHGAGDGTFAAPVVYAVLATPQAGQTIQPLAVALGDLNGDGRLDVVAACVLPQVVSVPGYAAVVLGQPGGFQPAVMLPTGQSMTNSVDLGDMDNDGDLDIVVSNWADHSISIVLNDGTGLAGPIGTERVGRSTSALATRFTLGDVDGDGWLDVCVLRDNSVHPLLGIGGAQAGFVRDVGITILVGSQLRPPTDVAADIALADLDGDGLLDLVAAITPSLGGTGRVVALRGLGAAAFAAEQPISQAHAAIDLALADLDDDGDIDVVAASGPQPEVVVCTNSHQSIWLDLGFALPGSTGTPCFDTLGPQLAASPTHLHLANVPGSAIAAIMVSPARWDLPIFGGVLVPDIRFGNSLITFVDPQGELRVTFPWPPGVPAGTALYWQAFATDPLSPNAACAAAAHQSIAP